MESKRHVSSPKHVFFHLLIIGLFYMGVVSLMQLLFVYIDLLFFDPLKYPDYWNIQSIYNTIRWTSSVLVVAGPVYLLLNRYIYKELAAEPELQHLRIRRWLLSFTLFVSAITMIVSLISVLFNFYGGDLTATFGCKVLVVIVISAAIFGYYQWDLKRDVSKKTKAAEMCGWGVFVAIIITIVAGFIIAGSPMHQRDVRFDETRLSDLQNIQSEILQYWSQKNALPDALSAVETDLYGYTVPTDPENAAAYEYIKVDALTFELCAIFSTDGSYGTSLLSKESSSTPARVGSTSYGYKAFTDKWQHAVGRACFTRAIDPDYLKTADQTTEPTKPVAE